MVMKSRSRFAAQVHISSHGILQVCEYTRLITAVAGWFPAWGNNALSESCFSSHRECKASRSDYGDVEALMALVDVTLLWAIAVFPNMEQQPHEILLLSFHQYLGRVSMVLLASSCICMLKSRRSRVTLQARPLEKVRRSVARCIGNTYIFVGPFSFWADWHRIGDMVCRLSMSLHPIQQHPMEFTSFSERGSSTRPRQGTPLH
jgi:hypothetical protein